MASGGKRKTTMAKLNRETRLRERRLDKQAKKDTRRQAASHDPGDPSLMRPDGDGRSAALGGGQNAGETVAQVQADA